MRAMTDFSMARKKLYYMPGDKVSGISKSSEWMLETGEEYIGAYHRYKSTGEVYTGSEYLEGISKPLIPYKNLNNQTEKTIFDYDKLTNDKFKNKYKSPIPFTPTPTQSDYNRGYLDRYIVSQFNNSNLYEVSKKNFEELDEFLYIKKEFKWKIGRLEYTPQKDIIDTNQKVINLLKNDISNIDRFLTNLKQFSV